MTAQGNIIQHKTLTREGLHLALEQLTNLCGTRAENNGWNNDFPQREDFADTDGGHKAYANAVKNWDAVKVSLFASEAFEAQDELRGGMDPTATYYNGNSRKPEGAPSEIADILVRVFHYCHFRQVDLASIFFEKLDYNDSRGIRHGGKGF